MATTYSDSAKLDYAKSLRHCSERAAIDMYLSDPSIDRKVARAMSDAYDAACRALESSGRNFSKRAVATLIANFAHDGVHEEAGLLAAVMNAYSPKARG